MTTKKTKAAPAAVSPPGPKFKKLDVKTRFALCKLLDEVLIKNEAENSCSYKEGWDDARVAREALADYPGNGKATVSFTRVQVFGHLEILPTRATTDLEVRVERLEQIIEDLLDRLGDKPEQRKAA